MDRFEWYTKRWKQEFKDGEEPPKMDGVSLLRAYEYDVEYAVSITTPNKFKWDLELGNYWLYEPFQSHPVLPLLRRCWERASPRFPIVQLPWICCELSEEVRNETAFYQYWSQQHVHLSNRIDRSNEER